MKKTRNFDDLKSFVPQNDASENYAILTHFLQMNDLNAKKQKKIELIEKFDFTQEMLEKAEEWYKSKEINFKCNDDYKFTFIDLFAGIGGFRLAMQMNGGKCVFSSEWDESAKQTYYENYGEVPYGDITKPEITELIPNNFDVLCAGFPCQPFSSIGKRQGFAHKTQGTLFFYIAQIIKEKQPKAFLLENVPGLISHNQGETLNIILETLKTELDYNVSIQVLNSADYGVPQERKRLYFVGYRKDVFDKEFKFPMIENQKVGIGKYIEVNATGPSISKHLQESYIFKKNDGHPEIIDSSTTTPVKTLCASYHKIQRITGTFVKGGDTGLRLLTQNECKAIMGFPNNFKIPVSRTQMYHQFGNSVAVPVIEKITKNIVVWLPKREKNGTVYK